MAPIPKRAACPVDAPATPPSPIRAMPPRMLRTPPIADSTARIVIPIGRAAPDVGVGAGGGGGVMVGSVIWCCASLARISHPHSTDGDDGILACRAGLA